MSRSKLYNLLIALGLIALLSACSVGPDYVKPTAETPDSFKEMKGWKTAQPKDDVIRGKWWEMYGDSQLTSLQEQVDISNQNLAAAEAQFRQARALVHGAQANYWPTISVGASVSRSGSGSKDTISNFSLPL